MNCRKCGAQIKESDKFCPECGEAQNIKESQKDQLTKKTSEFKILKSKKTLPIICGSIVLVILIIGILASKMYSRDVSNIKIGGGNISNNGLVAYNKGWIYYQNTYDDGKLYKMKSDGSNKVKVCDDQVRDISVVGDWIYYSRTDKNNRGIYKIKMDGSEKSKITGDSLFIKKIIGDWIYCESSIDKLAFLYKIKIDGTQETRLNMTPSAIYSISDIYIYYGAINVYDNPPTITIHRINTDGTSDTKISDEKIDRANVSDNYIYYVSSSDKKIYRMDLNGSNKKKICDDKVRGSINVCEGWIYYSNDPDNLSDGIKLYKVKVDGTSKTKLSDNEADDINVIGDYVYYKDYDLNKEKFYLCRVKTDGSGKMEMK